MEIHTAKGLPDKGKAAIAGTVFATFGRSRKALVTLLDAAKAGISGRIDTRIVRKRCIRL